MSESSKNGYSAIEERLNALTHGFGFVLAIIYSVFCWWEPIALLNSAQRWGLGAYQASLVILMLASALYHSFSNTVAKDWLKRLDHSAIYALIAGTYTAVLVLALNSTKAYLIIFILWGVVLAGTVFKLFFVHRFHKLSLFIYLLMGWAVLFFFKDLSHLPKESLSLLIAGGVVYSLGTLFYAAKKIKYTHAIWHMFVLVAAGLHAMAIYTLV